MIPNEVEWMFKGFYTAASGMMAQQRRTDMLTNNMANANTPGFKEDQSTLRSFPEMLLERMNAQKTGGTPIGSLATGVYMQEAIPRFIQGDTKETDNKTDMALVDLDKGSAFFTVQDPSGQLRYTRNGNFTLDAAGFLTTGDGQYILDNNNNPIQLSSDQFTVSDTGLITGANGEQRQLGIAYTNNADQQLIKEGNGLYHSENGTPLAQAANQQFKLQQGYLEQSNVDVSKAMTDMMTAYRSFEANQKILQAYDKSMDLAANQVGKIG
jgi:flagellar basal-body rod protein FlgG